MNNEEDGKGPRWLNEYEKTWEEIQDDDDGGMQEAVDELVHKAKRKRLLVRKANIRLGMIRHLFIIVDMSRSMKIADILPPNRLACVSEMVSKFIVEYFDQNPISQLGLIVTKDKRAEMLTKLSGNPKAHIAALQAAAAKKPEGEASLQNSLDVAMAGLRHLPHHASCEVLFLYGALTSCDPGDIFETIAQVKKQSIRCSIVGLSAEVKLCKTICEETQGSYNVILSKKHCQDLILDHLQPPKAKETIEASLVRMGFPKHLTTDHPSYCLCHIDSKDNTDGFNCSGFFCPQCHTKYCGLPVDCQVCGLQLVSAAHLARSYQHLFPLPAFLEIRRADATRGPASPLPPCGGCQVTLEDVAVVFRCESCQETFCNDCDLYIHETLRICPGCTSKPHCNDGF